ncbi:NAD(P)-binding protein, partial [Lichtheimia hyalospora FSU 10163]
PSTFKKYQAIEIGNDFRKVTRLVTVNYQDLVAKLKPHQVIVKTLHFGINASDVNFTNGKYIPGIKPPFDVGFEALGQIVAVGNKVTKDKIGSYVLVAQYGAFAEYLIASPRALAPVPNARPELLALQTSGLTSSLALEQTGRMTSGETVLVTAAAGGAGQFAVQLAKIAGNHVIGTCSSDDKVAMLKDLGCDRVINYKKEDFKTVLRKEYPKGIDIVFESGRLIVIGMMATYSSKGGMAGDQLSTIQLLGRSRTVAGFFLPDYKELWGEHMSRLIELINQGKLKVELD